jgi:PAS domain S-box-containing protein
LRRRATARLRRRHSSLSDMPAEDVQALVHELEIHRVELEVQNEDLRRAQGELAEVRDRYVDLYEFAPVGYLTLDTRGVVGEANLAAARLCGHERERLIGQRVEELVAREERDACYMLLREAAATDATRSDELRLARSDGPVRWVRMEVSPQPSKHGRTGGFRLTLSETTDRHEAEAALRAANAALLEANRRKDEFLAILAHELRNPLAPIHNGLAVLRRSGTDAEAAARVHEMMERQVTHLVRLVDDLLEASRISRGVVELRRRPVDLADIVRSAVETSTALIDSAGHRIDVRVPEEPVMVEADPTRLVQIVSNLLHNAVKYAGAAGGIELVAARDGEHAIISVRDEGVGISAEHQERIFDIFTQVDRASGGLGIGLTLVRSLAQMHGGSVEVHSAGLGKGSTFTLRLPLMDEGAGEAAPRHDAAPAALRARRVLVVDDNHDAADSLGMVLQGLGAEVRVTYGGAEALAALETWQPEVVLLDIGMPEMDGYELTRRIREQFPDQHPRLVAVTGWGQEDARQRVQTAGFDHHLVKPVEVDDLLRAAGSN